MQPSDRDRSFILKQLTAAPDSVLADAMLEYNLIRDKIVAVRKLAGAEVSPETGYTPSPETGDTPVEGDDRPNVNPGEPGIGKIGGKTKDQIIEWLKEGKKVVGYDEHLKLLWHRDVVKFDGKEWYL